MCGIYGYIGNPTGKTRGILRTLAILNEARGTDSSGVSIITPGNTQTIKLASKSSKLWGSGQVANSIPKLQAGKHTIVIGHTRQATTGKVNKPNAHPYTIGQYTFAHNGIIDNFRALQAKAKTDYKVDSQIIGHLLNKSSAVDVFEKKLSGWFAVPYVNRSMPSVLNIARHTSPLAFAVRPDGRGMYFSSEKSHLKQALKKHNERIPVNQGGNDRIYHFSWDGWRVKTSKTKLNIKPAFDYGNYDYGYNYYNTYNQEYIETAWGSVKNNGYLERKHNKLQYYNV